MREANFTVCVYHEGLAEPLRRFAQRVWNGERPTRPRIEASVHASPQNEDTRPQRSPTFLFLKDEDVIGHIATHAVRLLLDTQVAPAYWVVGFMVLPEFRNGLIGPLLIKEVNRTLDLAMTLHVEEPVLRIFKGLGWKHLGVVPQYVRVLNPWSLLKNIRMDRMAFLGKLGGEGSGRLACLISHRLIRPAVATGCALVDKVCSGVTSLLRPCVAPGSVTEEEQFDASYDTLWANVGAKYGTLVVRDRAYLEARYGQQMGRYRLLACRREDKLMGYCILRTKQFRDEPRMGNARMGSIIDCLFDPDEPGTFQLLLREAMQAFIREGVDVVFCSASHSTLRRLLLLNGFLRIPGSLNFAYYDRAGILSPEVDLDSWHLMRGDSDADANL